MTEASRSHMLFHRRVWMAANDMSLAMSHCISLWALSLFGALGRRIPVRKQQLATAAPPGDDPGCRGSIENDDRGDGGDIAPTILHRGLCRRLPEAPSPPVLLLAGSRVELAPVACEEACPTAGMLGAFVFGTIVVLEGQGMAAAKASVSAFVSGTAKRKTLDNPRSFRDALARS